MAIRRKIYRKYGLLVSTHYQSSNIIIRDFIFKIIQDGDLHNDKGFDFFCKSLSTVL